MVPLIAKRREHEHTRRPHIKDSGDNLQNHCKNLGRPHHQKVHTNPTNNNHNKHNARKNMEKSTQYSKKIRKTLKINETPTYSTTHTLLHKIPKKKIIATLTISTALAAKKPMTPAVDSTGISPEENSIKYILKHKPKRRR